MSYKLVAIAYRLELGAMDPGGELIAVVEFIDILNLLTNHDTQGFLLFEVLESPLVFISSL
jgi:hypothetical protein